MQGKEAGRKSSLMRGMTDCILKFLHFLCMLCQPQGCAEDGRPNSQGFSTSSNLASFQIRAEQEVFEIIHCDKGTSLFVHILLCRHCGLLLGRVQDRSCALSWLPVQGHLAGRRVQRPGLEGQGEKEMEPGGCNTEDSCKEQEACLVQGADVHPRCDVSVGLLQPSKHWKLPVWVKPSP